MRKALILCLFIFLISENYAQEKKADSLIHILNTQKLSPDRQLELYDTICLNIANNLEKSLQYGRKGLALAENRKDKVKASIFNNVIAGAYDAMAKYDSSFFYFNRALALGIEANNKRRQLAAIMNLGNSFTRQTKYRIALEYFMNTLDLCEDINHEHLYLMNLGNIAEIHLELKNYDRAVYYLEKSLRTAEETDNIGAKMQGYFILGRICHERQEYDRALHYQQMSAEISHNMHYLTYENYSMQAMAYTYIALNDYDNALVYAKKSLSIAEEINDPKLIARGWSVLADIYLEQKDYNKAEEAACTAWDTDSLSLDIAPRLAFIIGLTNAFSGNNEKSETFFKKHDTLRDSYIDKTYRESMLDMEVKYETEKKELHIASLEKEKQLYIGLGVSTGIALLLALGVIFYRNRMNSQKVKQLEQEKSLIAIQAELDGETAERTRLAQDLHDGLGGMLSVVKLTLNEISTSKELDTHDANRLDKALGILEQSMTELRHVAHHMMPASLMQRGLKTAIEDFCLAIPAVNFQFFGSDKNIDQRLAVIIYRSTFELVNNALKYAEATSINIQLLIDNGLVSLAIQDNGKGFDWDNTDMGFGLKNIKKKIAVYNGIMDINSSPGNGTEITIEIENQ